MIQNISPKELNQRLENGDDLVVIDVRMPWELEIASVEFASSIVLNELPQRLDEIPKDRPVVMICRSGGRSMQACQFLAAQGWDANMLYNLESGILGWARDVDPSLPRFY